MSYVNAPLVHLVTQRCTEVRFANFLSGGFITVIVVNPPEEKLKKRTSVRCFKSLLDLGWHNSGFNHDDLKQKFM